MCLPASPSLLPQLNLSVYRRRREGTIDLLNQNHEADPGFHVESLPHRLILSFSKHFNCEGGHDGAGLFMNRR